MRTLFHTPNGFIQVIVNSDTTVIYLCETLLPWPVCHYGSTTIIFYGLCVCMMIESPNLEDFISIIEQYG